MEWATSMECLICSADANGIHYKIRACRACSAFFRRTVHMKIRYKCKHQRDCAINHSEIICRHCRMKKCLLEGMHTEGSEDLLDYYVYGSYSETDFSPDERDVFSPAACIDNHEEFDWHLKTKISKILRKEYRPPKLPFKLSLCQQSAQAYENLLAKYAPALPQKARERVLTAEEIERFICDMFISLINIAEYMMEIEPFAKLPYREKVSIFKIKEQTFTDLMFSMRTIKHLGVDLNDTRLVMFDGHVADFNDTKFEIDKFSNLISNMKGEHILGLMVDTHSQMDSLLLKPLKRFNPDDFEVHYLLMKSIWDLDEIEGISTETMKLASEIQDQLDGELAHFYKYTLKLENVASRIYKINNLLVGIAKVWKIRENERHMCRTFDVFKFDLWIDDLP